MKFSFDIELDCEDATLKVSKTARLERKSIDSILVSALDDRLLIIYIYIYRNESRLWSSAQARLF